LLSSFDIQQMERALLLAEKARGLTSPNPIVGAVVARDDQVLGEGYHAGAGLDHAEVVAMKAAAGSDFAARLIGATVYVTLEPCCHFGRTPPCTKALVQAGVTRVVAGALDPSPRVNGAGLRQLREAGIEVEVAEGDLGHRARRQNGPFRKHAVTGLPFVTYKYAMTLDGRTATQTGSSRWISGPESRRRVHQLRAWTDAVMVGAGTLSADDPQLTVRDVSAARVPLRVVIDPSLSTVSASSALAKTAFEGPVLAVCSEGTQTRRKEEVRTWGVEVATVAAGADGFPDPRGVAELLGARGVQSVLMEGGPRFAAAWWDAGLVDQVVAFVAPILSGGATAPGPLPARGCESMAAALRLLDVDVEQSGEDIMISGYTREAY
jgi:diaminohydroxyphosphoribosylaminopyrimidine deaminase / 5-amino-6-(5-phosphoribosylamino)uracil reductase